MALCSTSSHLLCAASAQMSRSLGTFTNLSFSLVSPKARERTKVCIASPPLSQSLNTRFNNSLVSFTVGQIPERWSGSLQAGTGGSLRTGRHWSRRIISRDPAADWSIAVRRWVSCVAWMCFLGGVWTAVTFREWQSGVMLVNVTQLQRTSHDLSHAGLSLRETFISWLHVLFTQEVVP